MESLRGNAELFGEGRRQCRLDLELGGGEHRAQAQLGGGPGQAGQGQRLRLLRAEPGQPGLVAVKQLIAAAVTGVAVERDAGRVQRLHVPVDSPDRDLEFRGELRGRQPAPGLQEQDDRNETARARTSAFSTDSRCQWKGLSVRDMTFKEKMLTSRPPVEVAGRRPKRYYVISAAAPDLDGYLAGSIPSGHTR